jgi:3-oxoacid CoA-transferase subunit A
VLRDGISIMFGGFGPCGLPENLIDVVLASGARDLTLISTDCGVPDYGIGKLITERRASKLIAAYVGENPILAQQYLAGEIELELNPMGTLVERIRCGGAGIPAFYVKTGVGTRVAEGKETRYFGEAAYLLERWLRADLGLIKAHRSDAHGNLRCRNTARNFNAVIPGACELCVAEVEELGEIDPNHVHIPGIYVDRVVVGEAYEKRIERRTVRPRPSVITQP